MGIYRLKVVQRGTIIVDGVDSLEEAEKYVKNCNPVDEVNWSDSLDVMEGGIELQRISIPDVMMIKDFAEKIEILPAKIVKWLFLRGKIANFKSEISFEDMREFADEHGFICEKDV